MVRTQIQLPDELYERTKQLAKAKEVSLAELVRRGLEYILSVHPLDRPPRNRWKLDPAVEIGLRCDPFRDPDWRVAASMVGTSEPNPAAFMLNEGEGKTP